MTKKIRIGVAGDVGSFSEQAGLAYTQKIDAPTALSYLIDMDGVLTALSKGKIEVGIFPVMNTGSGLVKPAFAAMGKYSFVPIDEIWLDVQQCLLVLPGITRPQIEQIVSYPQALAQCSNYLHKEFAHTPHIAWQDTAKAARDLANGTLSCTSAIIAGAAAAEQYHLDILVDNIQNNKLNLTAFLVVTSPLPPEKNHLNIKQLRQAIKEADTLIIKHLAQRQQLSKKIGQLKARSGKEILDLDREQKLMHFHQRLSKKYHLESTYIQQIFKTVIQHSRKLQKR